MSCLHMISDLSQSPFLIKRSWARRSIKVCVRGTNRCRPKSGHWPLTIGAIGFDFSSQNPNQTLIVIAEFYAGGPFSKTSSPSANVIHGCFRLAQMCRVGRSQDVSSRVPARTRITPSRAGPAIQEPHSGQTHRVLVRPLSARRWSERGSTPLSRKPFSATTTPMEKALLVSRWQSRQ